MGRKGEQEHTTQGFNSIEVLVFSEISSQGEGYFCLGGFYRSFHLRAESCPTLGKEGKRTWFEYSPG